MKVIAVIVTYNAMKWIDRCMTSLRNSDVPIDIVVIDNGSTDGTRDYLPQHYPDIIWLPQEHNLGFGQANNIGLQYALTHDGDYVLLLNQDAWIDHDMITKLLSHDDNRTILSPIHLNGNGNDFDSNFRDNTVLRFSDITSLQELKDNQKVAPFEAKAVAAACWLVPIAVIRTIGGFNPLFFHYGEDHNFLDRAFYHGFTLKVIPNTFAYHDRKQFGNKRLYQKNLVYRYLLLCATNINTTPHLGNYLHICGFWCREGLKHKQLFHFICQSFSGLWQILRHRKQISDSRHKEQTAGLSWL